MALTPTGLLLWLLIAARWSAAAAGAVAAAAAMGLGTTVFGPASLATAFGPMLEALFQSATILWIIFPALCIHEHQTRSGGTAMFGRSLAGFSDDPRIVALLIAWFFVCFLEGAAGFGTPIALHCPCRAAAGNRRLQPAGGVAAGARFGVRTAAFRLFPRWHVPPLVVRVRRPLNLDKHPP